MSDFVIDSSVAVKWLFREPGSVEAQKLLERFKFFSAPNLFLIEMDSVITKKVRQQKLDASAALPKRKQVRNLPYKITAYENIDQLSFELAISLPVTLYDAAYVATAIENYATLYTADERLVNGLSNTSLSKYVKSIADL